jgi:hypothetical protein
MLDLHPATTARLFAFTALIVMAGLGSVIGVVNVLAAFGLLCGLGLLVVVIRRDVDSFDDFGPKAPFE